ncbi:glycosyltransferase family A protein [Methanobacterium formicicum]|uniref:Family 2 glycosyl transferase n=1 Tax=Methanobacterium formicicum (strain DSM 3637 / PP1) TaxID=1204725 RepID=K2RUP1_METFP|nr:glycosyltransferase family A protein [Methanobacterium formicicum]EKF86485.1 family 2 glycosyl transferase [Methanobacterium formicicum DSM 3637]
MESLEPIINMKSSESELKGIPYPDYPLVSIITPTYNHEKFIGTCIESVLKQTYPNWEMIIVDDGSVDGTGSIIKKYNDKRIKHVKQENVGIWKLNETYNRALNLAQGDLIAILEGDDAWPKYKLEEQVKIFEKPEVVLSWGRKNTINDKNEIISFDLPSLEPFMHMSQEEIIRNLLIYNFMQPCTVMIDKNALLSIGGFLQYEDAPFVDYSTFLELSLEGKFYPSDLVMGYWRKHKAQVTTTQEIEITKAFMISVDFYEKMDSSLKEAVKFNIDDKSKFHEKMLNDQIAVSSRLSLLNGNWDEAITQYKGVFRNGDFSVKLQAFLGIICALCRRDLEWLAVISCKPKLRDASGEWETTVCDKNKNLTVLFKIQIFTMNLFRRLCHKPILIVNL